MKLEEFVTQCAREAGLDMGNDREAHMYAQSVMPSGTADIEITPEEQPMYREILLRVFREHLKNPQVLEEQVNRQIAGN